MARLVLLYENFADSGIYSGGSWLAALPLTNMQDDDIALVARSSNATTAATKFTVNLGRVRAVDAVAFGPANLSPGSTWRARGYSDSGLTTLVYDTGIQTGVGDTIDWSDTGEWLEWEDPGFWYGISESLDELPQFYYHVAPTAQSAQYWLFEISDVGNFDGAVTIGRLLIAKAFRPSINYGESNDLSLVPLTDMEESDGGLRKYRERGLRRAYRCTFQWLDESEIFGDVFRMQLRSGTSRQVFVVPDSDDLSFGSRRSFLATFKTLSPLQQLLVDRGTTALDLEEVL